MKKFIYVPIITVLLLSGCASKSTKKVTEQPELELQQKIDQMILMSSISIQNQQTALFQAGALNQITIKPKVSFSNEDKLTVIWNGDAIQLLTSLAHNQKMLFKYSGVRLPLPIAIKSINEPLSKALEIIKSQINHKAQMDIENGTIHIKFNDQNW